MTTDTPTPRTDAIEHAISERSKDADDIPSAWNGIVSADFARTLERDLAECRAALAELVACKDAPRTAPMVGIHDYACPCTRLGKKSGPCNCLGKAAEARIGQAWATARALATKEPQP